MRPDECPQSLAYYRELEDSSMDDPRRLDLDIGQEIGVVPGLYIGGYTAACNYNWLKAQNIKAILSLGTPLLPNPDSPNEFIHKFIFMIDHDSQKLQEHLQPSITFIKENLEHGGVLVHCGAGISRSAAVVTAYLMHHFDVSCDIALSMVQAARHFVEPNDGFMQQLRAFQPHG